MSDDNNHLIKRQVIEVTVPSVESGWQIQNRVSEFYKYHMLKELNELFNSICGPDEVLRIDKLEVDLGGLKADMLEEEFAEKLKKAIGEKLKEIRINASSSPENGVNTGSFKGDETRKKDSLKSGSGRHLRTDLLVHFLRTGNAPWWYTKEKFGPVSDVAEEIFANEKEWAAKKLPAWLKDQKIRQRFQNLAGDKLLEKFLSLFNPSLSQSAFALLAELSPEIPSLSDEAQTSPAAFRRHFREALLMLTVFGENRYLVSLAPAANALKAILATSKKADVWNRFVADLPEAARAGIAGIDGSASASPGGKLKKKKTVLRKKVRKTGKPGPGETEADAGIHDDPEYDDDNLLPENETNAGNGDNPADAEETGLQKEISKEEQAAQKRTGKKLRLKKSLKKNKRKHPGEEAGMENDGSEKTTQEFSGEDSFSDEDSFSNEEHASKTDGSDAETRDQNEISAGAGKSKDSLFTNEKNETGGQSKTVSGSGKLPDPQTGNAATETTGQNKNAAAETGEQNKNLPEYEYEYEEVDEEDLSDFIVENAGLVLLWPFLSTFFTELGLITDKKFATEKDAHRAVHLLQYLAAPGLEYEEHELALNKIFCGLQVNDPVDMEFEPTAKERVECENLLLAVATNWKAIGKTSVDGLRMTFLQKEGALKKSEQGWNLYIERKTVDMLLDRLPWGISIVKFPWSEETIYVEW